MAAIIISLFVLGHLSPFVHGKFSHALQLSVYNVYIHTYIYMHGWMASDVIHV